MKKKPSRYIIYYTARIFQLFIFIVPLRLWLLSAGFFGALCLRALKKERTKTLEHLLAAFPEKSDQERYRIARGVFTNLVRNFFEIASFPKTNINYLKSRISYNQDGLKYLKEITGRGQGAVMVTAHFGNWEYVPASLKIAGFEGAIVARRIYFEKYNAIVEKIRRSYGVDIIYRDESPLKMIKLLKKGELLGLLADQDIDSIEGVFVNYFNRPTYTPKAPVALAIAAKVPIVPVFIVRTGFDCFRFNIEKPIYPDQNNDKEKEILALMQKWSDILEKYVREYPDQWVWMHRRWKTKPLEAVSKVA